MSTRFQTQIPNSNLKNERHSKTSKCNIQEADCLWNKRSEARHKHFALLKACHDPSTLHAQEPQQPTRTNAAQTSSSTVRMMTRHCRCKTALRPCMQPLTPAMHLPWYQCTPRRLLCPHGNGLAPCIWPVSRV
jgi:hypothetical protein